MKKQYALKNICLSLLLILCACTGQKSASQAAAGTTAITEIKNIPVSEVYNLILQEPVEKNYLLIDVRTRPEWYGPLGHISAAEWKPLMAIDTWIKDLFADKDKKIILVCRSGNRSSQAAKKMLAAGFTAVYNMEGGMLAWNKAEYPVEKAEQ